MLVPLETLSGWPAVDDPSALQVLGLLVGLPASAVGVPAGDPVLGVSDTPASLSTPRAPGPRTFGGNVRG